MKQGIRKRSPIDFSLYFWTKINSVQIFWHSILVYDVPFKGISVRIL